ncbi:MAG: YHS domain-containing protein [Gemmatimonadetes bacterium]|nr:YHS domain-containing protein [Gemmatimonadota bacterium]MBT8404045.1 YHS domain-containing protein [Gemmatimonadota bacterium]NNK64770.1 YHS domain-containing protein [Gemmatimonadota bacterium]
MKVHDEVCGMTIDTDEAAASCLFQGKRYYFCAARCKQKFLEHPEWYVAVDDSDEGDEGGPSAA